MKVPDTEQQHNRNRAVECWPTEKSTVSIDWLGRVFEGDNLVGAVGVLPRHKQQAIDINSELRSCIGTLQMVIG